MAVKNTPVQKNKEYIVDIIDNGFEGEGIAKIDNFTIFIPDAIKGEKVKILIVKVLSSHAFGKIQEIIQTSTSRTDPDCATYKRCGGCSLRHIEYKQTLKIKQQMVQNLVNKMLDEKIQVKETIGMDNPYHYRNKVQFPVGLDKNGQPSLGIFAKRTHEIIPIKTCLIQNETAQNIAKSIFEICIKNQVSVYQEQKQQGLIRHIIIKVGLRTNEYMCILVLNGKKLKNASGEVIENKLVEELTKQFPQIKTIIINTNTKNTNVILGEENRTIYGEGYITDKLGEFNFKISPFSFYQVNPIQAEKLYTIGVQSANISKQDTVFDLYCGIGTISLFMSKYAKKVYGIEIVKEAIQMAKENASNNNITNTEFIAGDVEQTLEDLISNKKIIPDIILVDPPRKGLDKNTIQNIQKITPKKLIYISCNPSTLMRDLQQLQEQYKITQIQPLDMFPFTSHVECVTVLNLK